MRLLEIICESNGGKFLPYQERGGYPLYSKERASEMKKALRFKENKVLVETLEEAIEKFQSGLYGWRLRGERSRQCNLFTDREKVELKYS